MMLSRRSKERKEKTVKAMDLQRKKNLPECPHQREYIYDYISVTPGWSVNHREWHEELARREAAPGRLTRDTSPIYLDAWDILAFGLLAAIQTCSR